MLWLPHERFSQDLALQAERDVRVREMRSSRRKDKKVFEYLVDVFDLDKLSTWITEDQLRISLSPTLLAELKGIYLHHEHHGIEIFENRSLTERISNSVFSRAQSEVYLKHPATSINDEHISRTSQSPITINYNHDTCDAGDDGPQPAKRRKPRSAPAVHDTEQGIVDGRSSDDPNDEDYRDMRGAAGSELRSRPRSRKRVRWAESTEDTAVKAASTHLPYVSCRAIAVTCPTDLEELQSFAPVSDANRLWQICQITDRKVVYGKNHYKVKWEDTWEPESELAGARELIDEFEAKL
jgi:Chromo (CHRromatin Organisation MOdifier) domain